MKKLILGAFMMLGFISFSTAQKADTTAKKHAVKKETVAKSSSQGKKTAAETKTAVKPTAAAAAKPATAPGVVLKKDGTPDKRFKNATDTGKGPLKKDGTPDKRYKANKKS